MTPLGELTTARHGAQRMGLSTVGTDAAPAPAVPARLGRYVVLDPLGAGGMGSVYSAWDRMLERRVALKVLHRQGGEHFQREARALARLAHPNVITVYDVVSADGHDFIAMELVEGMSLRRWLLARRRSWREVLAVFVHAGRGLAAAHAAGLVHRDFKPDNVLIADSGPVRVADFGLARMVGDSIATGDSGREPPSPLGSLSCTGTVAGTPRYMAPEQRSGRRPDVGVDQYSFCLAFREALVGRLPGEGEDEDAVPAARGRVPAWLRVALERGTSEDPGARFPSMRALLAVLEREVFRRRRRRALAAALVAAAVACAALAFRRDEAAPPCAGGEARLAGVWDAEVRARAGQAFLATGRGHAAATFAGAAAALDRHAATWLAVRHDVCEATVRGEQSVARLDQRMTCLDRDLRRTRALTELFARGPDAEVLDQSIQAVRRLDDPGACDGGAVDETPAPADPVRRAGVATLRERLAEVSALRLAGKLRQALPLATAAVAEARALAHAPALAEALYELALIENGLADAGASRPHFQELLLVAARAHDDALYFSAWLYLLRVEAGSGERAEEALAMQPVLEAALVRAGDDPERRARLDLISGIILKRRGDYAGSRASLERSLAALATLPGDQDLEEASAENELAITLRLSGELDGARLHSERALAIYTRVLGAAHPYVAGMLNNVGNLLRFEGKLDEARAHFARALELWQDSMGPESGDVATALTNLGGIDFAQGRVSEAARSLERARAIREKLFGPEDRRLAGTLSSLATAYAALGRLDDAEPLAQRALAIREKGGVPDLIAEALAAVASVARARGDLPAALAAAERGLALAAGVVPVEHPVRVELLLVRGEVLEAMRRFSEASSGYREVLAATAGRPADPDTAARVRRGLRACAH